MWKSSPWLVFCLFLMATVTFAQNGENEENGEEEGTLPRLEVTPGETDPPIANPPINQDFNQPLNQDFDPAANQNFPQSNQDFSDAGADFENIPSFPSLSEQSLGGLSGPGRLPISVFDMPSFGTVTDRQTIEERMPSDMIRALQQGSWGADSIDRPRPGFSLRAGPHRAAGVDFD